MPCCYLCRSPEHRRDACPVLDYPAAEISEYHFEKIKRWATVRKGGKTIGDVRVERCWERLRSRAVDVADGIVPPPPRVNLDSIIKGRILGAIQWNPVPFNDYAALTALSVRYTPRTGFSVVRCQWDDIGDGAPIHSLAKMNEKLGAIFNAISTNYPRDLALLSEGIWNIDVRLPRVPPVISEAGLAAVAAIVPEDDPDAPVG